MSEYADRIRAEMERDGHEKRTDPATVELIEALMLDGATPHSSGLDWMTESEFAVSAEYALSDAEVMAASGQLAEWCAARGLAVPEWATTEERPTSE